jgi:hypothetical protein
MSSTYTFVFNRTHTATFAADAMRNVLRDLLVAVGLDPLALITDWSLNGEAARTWLRSGHLRELMLEVYAPGSSKATARIDIPVRYDGSGVDDDMWVDRDHVRRTASHIGKLPAHYRYDVVFRLAPGAPPVPGMGSAILRGTGGLTVRSAGTVIATPDIVGCLRYWKAS